MKRIFTVGLISPAVLFLVFGTAAVAYAEKEQAKEARPEKSEQAKPEQKAPQRAEHEQKQQAKPAPQRAQQEQKQQAKPAPQRAQHEQKQQAKPAPQRAQHEQKQQAKPAPQRAQKEQKQQAKPAPQRAQHEQKQQANHAQQQQASSTHSRGGATVPQRTQQQARGWQQQRGWLHQGGGWQGTNSWQQGRASAWQSQHRTWAERGGYGGYYIPDATFALDFGDQHWFRLTSQPTIVGGFPRFRQDGFWFMMVDPWPESWSENWYATDDVYVGYNNGYYLYNRRYPGDAIAISIVL